MSNEQYTNVNNIKRVKQRHDDKNNTKHNGSWFIGAEKIQQQYNTIYSWCLSASCEHIQQQYNTMRSWCQCKMCHNINFSSICYILLSNLPLMLIHEHCNVGWPYSTGISFPSFVTRGEGILLSFSISFFRFILYVHFLQLCLQFSNIKTSKH